MSETVAEDRPDETPPEPPEPPQDQWHIRLLYLLQDWATPLRLILTGAATIATLAIGIIWSWTLALVFVGLCGIFAVVMVARRRAQERLAEEEAELDDDFGPDHEDDPDDDEPDPEPPSRLTPRRAASFVFGVVVIALLAAFTSPRMTLIVGGVYMALWGLNFLRRPAYDPDDDGGSPLDKKVKPFGIKPPNLARILAGEKYYIVLHPLNILPTSFMGILLWLLPVGWAIWVFIIQDTALNSWLGAISVICIAALVFMRYSIYRWDEFRYNFAVADALGITVYSGYWRKQVDFIPWAQLASLGSVGPNLLMRIFGIDMGNFNFATTGESSTKLRGMAYANRIRQIIRHFNIQQYIDQDEQQRDMLEYLRRSAEAAERTALATERIVAATEHTYMVVVDIREQNKRLITGQSDMAASMTVVNANLLALGENLAITNQLTATGLHEAHGLTAPQLDARLNRPGLGAFLRLPARRRGPNRPPRWARPVSTGRRKASQ